MLPLLPYDADSATCWMCLLSHVADAAVDFVCILPHAADFTVCLLVPLPCVADYADTVTAAENVMPGPQPGAPALHCSP